MKNKNAILNKVTSALPKVLGLVSLNDWSGPLAWQGGDTTLRDSRTCCSRAGTQKLIPNTPKPAQEKNETN